MSFLLFLCPHRGACRRGPVALRGPAEVLWLFMAWHAPVPQRSCGSSWSGRPRSARVRGSRHAEGRAFRRRSGARGCRAYRCLPQTLWRARQRPFSQVAPPAALQASWGPERIGHLFISSLRSGK